MYKFSSVRKGSMDCISSAKLRDDINLMLSRYFVDKISERDYIHSYSKIVIIYKVK